MKILKAVSAGKDISKVKGDITVFDVADAMKKYFRELKVPLIPKKMYKDFLAANGNPKKIKELTTKLPSSNYNIVSLLSRFLKSISYADF